MVALYSPNGKASARFSFARSGHYRWRMPVPSVTNRVSIITLFVCGVAASVMGCDTSAVSWIDVNAVPATRPVAEAPMSPTFGARDTSTAALERQLLRDLLHEANTTTALASVLTEMPESRESGRAQAPPPPITVKAAPTSVLGDDEVPIDAARCALSLRVALAPGRGRVAVWWSRRERDRVTLVAAWRDTLVAQARNAPWRGPIVIDSVDQGASTLGASFDGVAGCARPAPSIAVDDAHGYVHVAYSLTGPEGPGVFYAHQMDPRSAFEPTVAIVYGEALGAVRVAAQGDVVAVAYEEPNSGNRPRVSLAVSRTSGHLFEDRVGASSAVVTSSDPFVVVRGRAIVVGWSEMTSDSTTAFRVRRARVK